MFVPYYYITYEKNAANRQEGYLSIKKAANNQTRVLNAGKI